MTNLVRQLEAALHDFRASLDIDLGSLEAVVADAVRSGQAQKFEFTVELSWKTLKVALLDLHGIDLASPKSVFKKWFELGYLDGPAVEKLVRGVDIRNSLSHVYKKEAFLVLHRELSGYGDVLTQLAASLSEREAPEDDSHE